MKLTLQNVKIQDIPVEVLNHCYEFFESESGFSTTLKAGNGSAREIIQLIKEALGNPESFSIDGDNVNMSYIAAVETISVETVADAVIDIMGVDNNEYEGDNSDDTLTEPSAILNPRDSRIENYHVSIDNFNGIKDIEGVKEVYIADKVIVETGEIISRDGERNFGRFQISYDIKNNTVNISNVEYTVSSAIADIDGDEDSAMDHPHVHNTRPCFGTAESTIMSALANKDLKLAFMSILEFLRNYNPDDEWGQSYRYFKEA